VSTVDELQTVLAGRDLSELEAGRLERGLARDPDDGRARLELLGYHRLAGRSPDRRRRAEHVLWLIEHHPEWSVTGTPFAHLDRHLDREAYERAERAWLAHVRTTEDPAVVGNAAAFFATANWRLSLQLLEEGSRRWPADRAWSMALARQWMLRAATRSEPDRAAAVALEHLRAAEPGARRGRDRVRWLMEVAMTALTAGDPRAARGHAQELLQAGSDADSEDRWAAVHRPNVVLGRVALAEGAAEEAEAHLLAACRVAPTSALVSFGPNTSLARDLLLAGRPDAVLVYLDRFREIWTSGAERLAAWEAEVRQGGIPDFGANLWY
jgi:hypothetical protein